MKRKSLEPDVAGALARLNTSSRDRAFPIPTRTFSHRAHEIQKRRLGKIGRAFIKPQNAAAVNALDSDLLAKFDLILSHYFQSTSRELFSAIDRDLAPRPDCRVVTARTHCKIAVFTWPDRPALVIESSANLRSSGNLEQISAFADDDLAQFHLSLFESLFASQK